MRTKALLLAAAFAAVGVATSVAQVYSVNAVGYVNVPLTPGFNLVSNPLDAGPGNNTIGNLFKNITPSVPAGLRVYAYNSAIGGYEQGVQYSGISQTFTPADKALIEIKPGEGAFVFDPRANGSAALTLTFVGEVMQGNLVNPLPLGFSIKANQVPQAGAPNTFGLPGTGGDRLYRFNKATGAYSSYSYSGITQSWRDANGVPGLPSIDVGEAFFLYRATTAGTWNRTFNVNNPS